MSEKKIYTLSQVAKSIENVIHTYCNKYVWIKAEIVKLNYYSKTGHCYPALVEKRKGKVVAEMRGNIWGSNFNRINNKFRSVLKEELRDDMTVVINGVVTYHPVHGLALNIVDIDPEYTLGELAREKAETIERLKDEDIFFSNKRTTLPPLPKTIAVISVDSSKGYQDFLNVIQGNSWGYKYQLLLFPAILQGERAVSTIIEQLERIRQHLVVFDAVAIIRGGGGEIGLSSFDSYDLAKKIATFPLPVLTGIGHSSNETVTELVSFQSFITPTKIAEFLIQKFHDFAQPLRQKEERLSDKAGWLFRTHKTSLRETARLFSSLTHREIERSKSSLDRLNISLISHSGILLKTQHQQIFRCSDRVTTAAFQRLLNRKNDLERLQQSITSESRPPIKTARWNIELAEEKVRMLSPMNILKRGYSITRQNGRVVQNVDLIDREQLLDTHVFNGRISSTIEQTEKKETHE